MTQHIDVGDRLTTIGDHHRDVDEDTAPVMKGHKRASGKGLGQLGGQTRSVTHETEPDAARVGHHAGPATSYRQAG